MFMERQREPVHRTMAKEENKKRRREETLRRVLCTRGSSQVLYLHIIGMHGSPVSFILSGSSDLSRGLTQRTQIQAFDQKVKLTKQYSGLNVT